MTNSDFHINEKVTVTTGSGDTAQTIQGIIKGVSENYSTHEPEVTVEYLAPTTGTYPIADVALSK